MEKVIGYVDLCAEDIKRIQLHKIELKGGGLAFIQSKSDAKKMAKEWSKALEIKYKVYKIVLEEVK